MNDHTQNADTSAEADYDRPFPDSSPAPATPQSARNAILHTFHVRGLDVTGSADFSFEETLTGTPLLALESTSSTGTIRGEVDATSA